MTTHYQKIQALGNRMAENLTIMGVPSQFDEGGLTLADKILEISSGITTGLLLYGDKKVAQSGDTVNLSMMVLEDGEFKPNTNVILHETILDKTYSTHSFISKSIGDNWVIEGPFENIISSSDTSGTTITAWGNGKLTVNVGGSTVYHDNEAGSISKISYINKILSYNNKTVDLTEYNASFNVLSNVNAGRIIVKTAYVLTTDTHGLATHAYTCSGSGLKEFYATSGTFVSEPCNVWDTLFYDNGGTSVDKWDTNKSGGLVITYPNNEYTNIANTNVTVTNQSYLSSPNNISGDIEVLIEVNIPLYRGNVGQYFGFRNWTLGKQTLWRATQTGWRYYKVQRINGEWTGYVKANLSDEWTSINPQYNVLTENEDVVFCFTIYNPTTDTHEIGFKNLKIYSI